MKDLEHAEHGRDCSGDVPRQRDPSDLYADDPEFLREACRQPREQPVDVGEES